jgi:uncharacterized membrane protein HdeD (DUF308 family)
MVNQGQWSRLGLILVGIYSLIFGVLVIETLISAARNNSDFWRLAVILLALPASQLVPPWPTTSNVALWLFVVLAFLINALLIYGLGYGIEWLVHRLRA